MRNIKNGDKVIVTDISHDFMAYTDTEGQFEEYSEEWWKYIEDMKSFIGKTGTITNIECDFVEVTFESSGEQYFSEYDLRVTNA